MRRLLTLLMAGSLVLLPCFTTLAKDAPPDKDKKAASKDEDVQAPSTETAVRTKHNVSINGHSVSYTATAGTVIIRDDKGEPQASVFYVAWSGVTPKKRRMAGPFMACHCTCRLWLR